MPRTITRAAELGLEEEVILPGFQSGPIKRATAGAQRKLSTAKPEQVIKSPILGARGESLKTVIPAQPDQGIPFETAQANFRRLGARIRQAERGITMEDAGGLRTFRGAMMEDMEQAGEAFPMLKQANARFKREAAIEDLTELLQPRSVEGRDLINPDAVLNSFRKLLRKDPLFSSGLGGDAKIVEAVLKEAAQTTNKAGRVGIAIASSGIGGGLAYGMGLPPSMVGMVGAGSAWLGPEMVEAAILNPVGRKLFLRFLEEGRGTISRQAMGIVLNAARASQGRSD